MEGIGWMLVVMSKCLDGSDKAYGAIGSGYAYLMFLMGFG